MSAALAPPPNEMGWAEQMHNCGRGVARPSIKFGGVDNQCGALIRPPVNGMGRIYCMGHRPPFNEMVWTGWGVYPSLNGI